MRPQSSASSPLSSTALTRSSPNGFSTTTRLPKGRPTAQSVRTVGANRRGGEREVDGHGDVRVATCSVGDHGPNAAGVGDVDLPITCRLGERVTAGGRDLGRRDGRVARRPQPGRSYRPSGLVLFRGAGTDREGHRRRVAPPERGAHNEQQGRLWLRRPRAGRSLARVIRRTHEPVARRRRPRRGTASQRAGRPPGRGSHGRW